MSDYIKIRQLDMTECKKMAWFNELQLLQFGEIQDKFFKDRMSPTEQG